MHSSNKRVCDVRCYLFLSSTFCTDKNQEGKTVLDHGF